MSKPDDTERAAWHDAGKDTPKRYSRAVRQRREGTANWAWPFTSFTVNMYAIPKEET